MAAFYRSVIFGSKKLISSQFKRNISLSPVNQFKTIIEKRDGNTLTIEAKIVPDPNDSRLVKEIHDSNACPLCALGLDVKYTDVLILSQFMRPDGCVLPKRLTGLCNVQQKRVESLVAMAQKAGLMPNLTPNCSKRDPKRRQRWKRYNTYFDETTIKHKYYGIFYRDSQ